MENMCLFTHKGVSWSSEAYVCAVFALFLICVIEQEGRLGEKRGTSDRPRAECTQDRVIQTASVYLWSTYLLVMRGFGQKKSIFSLQHQRCWFSPRNLAC